MTRVIDFANLDFAALRESVGMEARADLLAFGGNFGEAAALMREANRIRSGQFGPWNPNELRDFTTMALAQGTEARRAATVKQGAVHDGPVASAMRPEGTVK